MKFTFRNSWLARSPDLWPVWAAAAFAVLLVWVLPAAAGAQQPTTPERPTGLHATEIAHNSVSLAWDDPSDGSVTGYRILRRDRDNDAPGVFTTIEADTGSSAASHVDATAQAQRRYVYRVVARNAAGDSPRSSYVNVETPAAPLPARPTGLQATEVAHDSVSLEWADPGDDSITGYQVLRRARDGDEYGDGEGAAAFVAVVDNTGTAATSYTDTTVHGAHPVRVPGPGHQLPGDEPSLLPPQRRDPVRGSGQPHRFGCMAVRPYQRALELGRSRRRIDRGATKCCAAPATATSMEITRARPRSHRSRPTPATR